MMDLPLEQVKNLLRNYYFLILYNLKNISIDSFLFKNLSSYNCHRTSKDLPIKIQHYIQMTLTAENYDVNDDASSKTLFKRFSLFFHVNFSV